MSILLMDEASPNSRIPLFVLAFYDKTSVTSSKTADQTQITDRSSAAQMVNISISQETIAAWRSMWNDRTACIYLEHPSIIFHQS